MFWIVHSCGWRTTLVCQYPKVPSAFTTAKCFLYQSWFASSCEQSFPCTSDMQTSHNRSLKCIHAQCWSIITSSSLLDRLSHREYAAKVCHKTILPPRGSHTTVKHSCAAWQGCMGKCICAVPVLSISGLSHSARLTSYIRSRNITEISLKSITRNPCGLHNWQWQSFQFWRQRSWYVTRKNWLKMCDSCLWTRSNYKALEVTACVHRGEEIHCKSHHF